MSTNRATWYAKVHKVLKKHYKPVIPPTDRPLLEHLLYACCLENARYDVADEAFAKLQLYADWNEVRVTTVTELTEVMEMLPDPDQAARRLKQTLQSVFETRYSYDLEYLKKNNLGKALKELEEFRGVTPFSLAYAGQHGLGGHNIAANRGVFEALVALGVITESEAQSGRIPGMERAIPKTKGTEFSSLIHQLGVDYLSAPHSAKLKAILQEINPEAVLPKKGKKTTRQESDERVEAAAEAKRQRTAKLKAARRRRREAEKAKKTTKETPASPKPAKSGTKSKEGAKASGKTITKKKPK
jgi:tetratricopeptide (TPR) repeat protein